MKKQKDNIQFWRSMIEVMLKHTPEEREELLVAMKNHLEGEPISFKSPLAKCTWWNWELQIKADEKRYAETCEKNSANIKAYWERKKALKDDDEKNTTEYDRIRANTGETNVNDGFHTDTDTDTEQRYNKEKIYKKEKTSRFVPPTVQEIELFCVNNTTTIKATSPEEKDIVIPLNAGYALDFYEHYSDKGWCIGKTPMKNWRLTFMRWNRENYKREKQRGQYYGNAQSNSNRNNRNAGTFNESTGDYGKFDEM